MRFLLVGFLVGLSACATKLNPFYYTATRGEQTLRLFGTLHQGIYLHEIPEAILHDLDRADVLACEVTDELDTTRGQLHARDERAIRESIHAKRSLATRLTPESWSKFRRLAPEGTPKERIEYLPPRLALTNFLSRTRRDVSVSPSERSRMQAVLDRDIYLRALAQKKTLVRLDTSEVMSDDCYLRFLERLLQEYNPDDNSLGTKQLQEFRDMRRIYMRGDEAELASLTEDELTGECLMDDRHRVWLKALTQWSGPVDAFVAVGAAHLVGSKNLLKLLESEGYTIRRWQADR